MKGREFVGGETGSKAWVLLAISDLRETQAGTVSIKTRRERWNEIRTDVLDCKSGTRRQKIEVSASCTRERDARKAALRTDVGDVGLAGLRPQQIVVNAFEILVSEVVPPVG